MKTRWVRVAPLLEGAIACLELDGERIAMFRIGGRYFALRDECPHRAGPLSEGTVETTTRGTFVMCPFHGWQFDVATGACATVRGQRVRAYVVRVDGDEVHVELPDDTEDARG